jgi:hypothetical protein
VAFALAEEYEFGMAEIEIAATPEAAAYLREIASEMCALFGLDWDEACRRINYTLRGREFKSDGQVDFLLHEEQDVWAKHIYYGRETFWWVNEAIARPKPFPEQ